MNGREIILPDLCLGSKQNQHFEYSGMDSLEKCQNKKHFLGYPHKINYSFNSRGFRDQEWPSSMQELQDAIWCIGDSFTVGVGSPYNHTWPQILSLRTNARTVNVGMDGASNNWISRRVNDIMQTINPRRMIVMWSYVERREIEKNHWWAKIYKDIRDPSWPDCDNILDIEFLPTYIKQEIVNVHNIKLPFDPGDEDLIHQDIKSTDQEHYENWKYCVDLVAQHNNIIHSVIPRFVPDDNLDNIFWQYLKHNVEKHVDPFLQLDWARDGHHFDILTAQHFVSNLMNHL